MIRDTRKLQIWYFLSCLLCKYHFNHLTILPEGIFFNVLFIHVFIIIYVSHILCATALVSYLVTGLLNSVEEQDLQYRKIQVSHFELRCVIICSGLSYLILDVLYLSFKTI